MTRRIRTLAGFAKVALVAATVALSVAGCGGGGGGGATVDIPAHLPHLVAADAAAALASFNAAFYVSAPSLGYYVDYMNGTHAADFWREAEMIETVEDYAQLTGKPAYRQLVVALCRGVLHRYRTDWLVLLSQTGRVLPNPRANDDAMWMIIAFARAAQITGDTSYLDIAKTNFDQVYARAWSMDLGGGLWWRTSYVLPQKNATTNAPAVIAACEIYRATHDGSYLAKAQGVYAWMRAHLFDPTTGQVYDALKPTGGGSATVNRIKFTYDQGSFIGAGHLLYSVTGDRTYDADALRALEYTRTDLTTHGILQNDAVHADQDEGGFKGIFARWAIAFTRADRMTTFDSWFRLNAAVAWAHRNARGLAGWDWMKPPVTGPLYSWDCSSAVAMMECLLPGPGK